MSNFGGWLHVSEWNSAYWQALSNVAVYVGDHGCANGDHNTNSRGTA